MSTFERLVLRGIWVLIQLNMLSMMRWRQAYKWREDAIKYVESEHTVHGEGGVPLIDPETQEQIKRDFA